MKASGTFLFSGYPANGSLRRLEFSTAALFPLRGPMPRLRMNVTADEPTELRIELRTSSRPGGFTPDLTLDNATVELRQGEQEITVDLKASFDESTYVFVCFMANPAVRLGLSDSLLTGTTTVLNQINLAVSNYGRQDPPEGIGIESFEFWCPLRRPEGKNIAFTLEPPLEIYSTENLAGSLARPYGSTNAWAAPLDQENPELTVEWPAPREVSSLTLFFDTDADHAMETVQMGHYDSVMPYCVRSYSVADDKGNTIASAADNHQAVNTFRFDPPVSTSSLTLRLSHPGRLVPASLFHMIIK